ncbi:MAG: hypothetical protein AAB358_03890 [Patescibacteria group bacterium]
MPKSPEKNLMSHDEAEEEAEKMRQKVESGEVEGYDEVKRKTENENMKNIESSNSNELPQGEHDKENESAYENSVEHVDKRLKKLIEELHDRYHPEAIFMTQTSATLLGWSIKEAWKNAWPNEKVPIILTINVNEIKDKYNHRILSENDPGYEFIKNRRHLSTRGFNPEQSLERINAIQKMIDNNQLASEGLIEQAKWAIQIEKEKLIDMENIKNGSSYINYGGMGSPSGFSLQLANENWPEFIKLKKSLIKKIEHYGINGNIAVVDENAGYRLKGEETPWGG